MPEKRMLIVPAELVRKIDENRGDLTQADFIEFLINGQLKEPTEKESDGEGKYVTKEEISALEADIKHLLKNFLDFFVSYGLELGKESPKTEFEQLSARLHELESDLTSDTKSDSKRGEAKIKWK